MMGYHDDAVMVVSYDAFMAKQLLPSSFPCDGYLCVIYCWDSILERYLDFSQTPCCYDGYVDRYRYVDSLSI